MWILANIEWIVPHAAIFWVHFNWKSFTSFFSWCDLIVRIIAHKMTIFVKICNRNMTIRLSTCIFFSSLHKYMKYFVRIFLVILLNAWSIEFCDWGIILIHSLSSRCPITWSLHSLTTEHCLEKMPSTVVTIGHFTYYFRTISHKSYTTSWSMVRVMISTIRFSRFCLITRCNRSLKFCLLV